jgi:hypothetical protein
VVSPPLVVRRDQAPAAGTARRGRSAPPPSLAAMTVICELLDDEDPTPLARLHSSMSPAPARALPSIPELGSCERAPLHHGELCCRVGWLTAGAQVGTSSRRPSAAAMAPTGDERERTRLPSPASPPTPA